MQYISITQNNRLSSPKSIVSPPTLLRCDCQPLQNLRSFNYEATTCRSSTLDSFDVRANSPKLSVKTEDTDDMRQSEDSDVCYDFYWKGFCMNGNQCAFEHVAEDEKRITIKTSKLDMLQRFPQMLLNRIGRINSFLQ